MKTKEKEKERDKWARWMKVMQAVKTLILVTVTATGVMTQVVRRAKPECECQTAAYRCDFKTSAVEQPFAQSQRTLGNKK